MPFRASSQMQMISGFAPGTAPSGFFRSGNPAFPTLEQVDHAATARAGTRHAVPPVTAIHRRVYCLLGLPFDAVDLGIAARRLDASILMRRPCMLATPNVNFVASALTDPVFRNAVLTSQLSVVDGMPLVWIARLLGVPIPSRVAGSDLFELMQHRTGRTIGVYFFGGADGTAQAAAEAINREHGTLRCVGYESPGFGSIDEMSSPEALARINASGSDFLVLSLGARKGLAWIERNRKRLTVPVVSHLGAVLNFVAGSVERAPAWLRHSGLEWLWRIKEEPALWRRYWFDGKLLFTLLLRRVLPLAAYNLALRFASAKSAPTTLGASVGDGGACRLTLAGAWTAGSLSSAREAFDQALVRGSDIELDLAAVNHIDSAFIGMLMLAYGHQVEHGVKFDIVAASRRVRWLLRMHCADYLLEGASRKAS